MLSKGIEISGLSKARLGDWNIRLNYKYSYTDAVQAELDKPTEASAVIYIPKHQAFSGLTVVYKKISAGINYQYMNRRYTTKDQDPLFALDDLHLVNLSAKVIKNILYNQCPGKNYSKSNYYF